MLAGSMDVRSFSLPVFYLIRGLGDLSVDEGVGTGGEEVGAALKVEVFCDAVEDVSLFVGYFEICMLSHFCCVG